MREGQKTLHSGRIFSYAVILIVMLVYLVPLGYAIITAFKQPGEFLKNPLSLSFFQRWKTLKTHGSEPILQAIHLTAFCIVS